MKAPAEDQRALLELQNVDRRIAKLTHEKAAHPAHARIRESQTKAQQAERARILAEARISDVQRDQARIEAEIEQARKRRAVQQERLDQGKVPLRDMSVLQHEIDRISQRIAELEDSQLEAMEAVERAEAQVRELSARRDASSERAQSGRAELDHAMLGVDAGLRELASTREGIAHSVAPALLAEYERLRARTGGQAVVEVRDGVPIGAPTEFSPAELDTIRGLAPDEVYWAEETQQIVVRTHEE